MPVVTQNFNHVLDTNVKTTAGIHDYTGKLTNSAYAYKESSEIFFNDLKSMLENLPGLDITFSDQLTYEDGIAAPSFKIWDLEFSPVVISTCTHTSSYSLTPFIFRHYEYSPISYTFKYSSASTKDMSSFIIPKTRINDPVDILKINYSIEIRYNEDYLLIEYRPYENKAIKFTLCCLIKGADINGKTVVYCSGGCNTYSTGSPFEYAHHWITYHKLIWSESPNTNPYTGDAAYPAYNTTLNIDRTLLSNNIIFMDLVNNTTTPHSSKIELIGDIDNILLQKPICCWGRVNFSDNILTGPISLTVDTDYEVNGETYYCPGDYVTLASMQAGVNYSRYGTKFLLKI